MTLFIFPIYTCLLLYIFISVWQRIPDGILLALCSELELGSGPSDAVLHMTPTDLQFHSLLSAARMWIEVVDIEKLRKVETCLRVHCKHRPDSKYLICKFDILISGLHERWDLSHRRVHDTMPASYICSSCFSCYHFWAYITFSILPTHFCDSSTTSRLFNWFATQNTLLMTSLNCLAFFVAISVTVTYLEGRGEHYSSGAWKHVSYSLILYWKNG